MDLAEKPSVASASRTSSFNAGIAAGPELARTFEGLRGASEAQCASTSRASASRENAATFPERHSAASRSSSPSGARSQRLARARRRCRAGEVKRSRRKPTTVRWLDEVALRAEQGDLAYLRRAGRVFQAVLP